MVHGLGEHIQRYVAWAEIFKKEGIGFLGVDLPGSWPFRWEEEVILKAMTPLGEMIDILAKKL